MRCEIEMGQQSVSTPFVSPSISASDSSAGWVHGAPPRVAPWRSASTAQPPGAGGSARAAEREAAGRCRDQELQCLNTEIESLEARLQTVQDADQAADRAQLEVRYRDLRRNISLWDQRFQAENGRPPRSIDQPFHIEQQRAEYQSIKAQLGLGCVHAGASSETA